MTVINSWTKARSLSSGGSRAISTCGMCVSKDRVGTSWGEAREGDNTYNATALGIKDV
jgi:hypothetical protein